MTTRRRGADGPLTLTHARLRAAQGDHEAARRILEAFLRGDPHNAAAAELLRGLDPGHRPPALAEDEAAPAPRVTAHASQLAARFRGALGRNDGDGRRARLARLRRWLATLERRAAG